MRAAHIFPSLLGLLLAFAALPQPVAAETAEIAKVISLTPDAWAERPSGRAELALKAPLFLKDSVVTNASGKVQLLFNDDTTVSVAPGSQIMMEDFVVDGAQSRFGMKLGGGMARVVTGKLVKLNPEGFTVTTPQAVVGIRGTDCTIMASGGKTTIIANRIHTRDIVVTNIATGKAASISRTGQAVDVNPQGNTLRPATEQERAVATQAARNVPSEAGATEVAQNDSESGSRNAAQSGQGTSEQNSSQDAAKSGTQTSSQASSQTGSQAGSQAGSLSSPVSSPNGAQNSPPQAPPALENNSTPLDKTSPSTGKPVSPPAEPVIPPTPPIDPPTPPIDPPTPPVDPPIDPPTPPVDPPTPPTNPLNPHNISGAFSGSLTANAGSDVSGGNFQFNVNLGSGAVNDASMALNNNDGQFLGAYGGSGNLNGANFAVNNWGTVRNYQSDNTLTPSLSGTFAPGDSLTGVNWNVADSGGPGWHGSGSGLLHNPSDQPAVLDPLRNVKGSYMGKLIGTDTNSVGYRGNFQFDVALATGGITNAAMEFYTLSESKYFTSFYGGTGRVKANRDFTVNDGWQQGMANPPSTPPLTPSLSGNFIEDGTLTGVRWELAANGGAMFTGTGNSFTNNPAAPPSVGVQDPRNIQGTYSLPLLDRTSQALLGSLSFDVTLGSGQVTNAEMSANNIFAATAGFGNINANREFNVSTWGNIEVNPLYPGAVVPRFNGQFNPQGNGIHHIVWNY